LDITVLQLSSAHGENDILPQDNVILLTGDIQVTGFGNASAVIYDGETFQPYLLATKSDGSNGLIRGLFSQNTPSFSSQGFRPIAILGSNGRSRCTRGDHCHRTGDLPFSDPVTCCGGDYRGENTSCQRGICPCAGDASNWGGEFGEDSPGTVVGEFRGTAGRISVMT
jgi:hypothetical protein